MQNYIDRALESFQPVFSRTSTWLLFCAIVIGFMGAGEMIGVTSLCRYWLLDEDGYNRLLHRCETIEVGQPVTQLPPHRSRRAELPHRALQNCSLCTRHFLDS